MPDGDVIEYLVAHGAYVEAARLAARRGELGRAIELYERVWRFADAWPLAVELGEPGLAVRLALDANLPAEANAIADRAVATADLAKIAAAFDSRGRPFEAARAWERAGDWRQAAGRYRRAGAPFEEARVLAAAGEPREAGLIYERLIAQAAADPGAEDEGARARLALGRLLGRLGHQQEAARQLQLAARRPSSARAARRALVGPLLALGYRGAAAEIVERLRQEDPALPAEAEELAALEAAEAATEAAAFGAPAARSERRFELRRLLGGDALGRVYEAADSLLGASVALKLLSVGGPDGELEQQAYLRFTREAEAAGRLRHPNIVTLLDAQPMRGLFVFELLPGGTLAERLAEQGPLPLVGARRLGLDLLAALGAAHERGIVHRDVKPANVLYDAAGNAKLGDFGGAHLADFGQTQTGGFLGTVAYMSPEQITGSAIGFAADLYALGATLYEAVTGRPPFHGPDLVGQHLSEKPAPPSSLRVALGPDHDRVLLRALAKSPGERYASAVEMADAIAAWPIEEMPRAAPVVEPRVATNDASIEANSVASIQPLAPEPSPRPPDRELGRTPSGRLVRRHDPRTAREVLVEERAEPLDDAGLEALRRLAAAGGPRVQRVLRLSEDLRDIWYEIVPGEVLPLEALTDDEQAVVATSLAALPVSSDRRFVRSAAGPVLWIAPLPATA